MVVVTIDVRVAILIIVGLLYQSVFLLEVVVILVVVVGF